MMRKGNIGISLNFYPVVAFVLAIFGQWLMCLLVLGLAMVLEKDEWTTRQCMQAFFLGLIAFVSNVIWGFVNQLITFVDRCLSFDRLAETPSTFYAVMRLIAQVCEIAILVVVFIFALMAIVKVMRGQEANTPLVSKWAYKAYGYVQPAPPQYNQYNPGYPPQQGQPPMGQPPMGQPPMNQPPMGGMQPPPPPPANP